MFDVIRKRTYWEALDDRSIFRALGGSNSKAIGTLKHIQDAWVLLQLGTVRNKRILEIGGGASRVLPVLDASNERWNLDEFEGEGNGLTGAVEMPGIRLLRQRLGSFAPELAADYFDVAFSISVIEHIPGAALAAFWEDHARVLKRGGLAYHAVDMYICDEADPAVEARINQYLSLPEKHGLRPEGRPALPRPVVFRSDMASNSDWGMWRWNRISPKLIETRKVRQAVSLGVILRKSG